MFNKSSKVRFIGDQIDDVSNDNAVLQRKLQSKIDALVIMSQDYDRCCMERDKYKLLVEQMQGSWSVNEGIASLQFPYSSSRLHSSNGEQMLIETKEKNKKLILEVETLKQKLEEAQEDIKVLRNQLSINDIASSQSNKVVLSSEREELVEQLEWTNKKMQQLQEDLQAVLDEKDEVIVDRDAYKCKLHRLNHQLNVVLSTKEHSEENVESVKMSPLLDIDALVMENRYLQERLQQIQAEKDLAAQTTLKYKGLLESKRKKGIVKLGTNVFSDIVMSQKEVKQLLEYGSAQDLPISSATIADLRSLSVGLLEALNDKSIALVHQRKTNKILAARITELEKRMQNLIGVESNLSVFPSKILLDNYNPSEVDAFSKNTSEEASVNQSKVQINKECRYSRKDSEAYNEKNVNIVIGGAFCSDSSSSAGSSLNEDKSGLPPELEELVQRALKDMQTEDD